MALNKQWFYINSGFKPLKTTNQFKGDFSVIYEVIRTYQDHPSVKEISSAIKISNTFKQIFFSFEVQKHFKNLDTKKATGFDKIPPK